MDISKFAPRKFKGDFKEDAKIWMFQFNMFAEAAKFSDAQISEFLLLLFDEQALLWYQYLPENVKENKDSLVAAFDDIYGTTLADRMVAMDEASHRRQRPDESVASFVKGLLG